jgi:hypothetical protein
MPRNAPPLAPGFDFDTYLVLDEFEKFRVYREADETEADRGKVIEDISSGQYNRPVRVISFNTGEGWSRDVTKEIAHEIVDRALRAGDQLTTSAQEFAERVLDKDVPVSLAAGH